MSYHYNPATKTFYAAEIFKEAPEGATVTVTDEERATLAAQMSTGKVLKSDANGTPYTENYVKTGSDILKGKQSKAQKALDKSDITILRCIEHGIEIPAEWVTYRDTLRAIVSETDEEAEITVPDQPDYPAGS